MLKLPLEAVHEYKTHKRGNYGWAVTHVLQSGHKYTPAQFQAKVSRRCIINMAEIMQTHGKRVKGGE